MKRSFDYQPLPSNRLSSNALPFRSNPIKARNEIEFVAPSWADRLASLVRVSFLLFSSWADCVRLELCWRSNFLLCARCPPKKAQTLLTHSWTILRAGETIPLQIDGLNKMKRLKMKKRSADWRFSDRAKIDDNSSLYCARLFRVRRGYSFPLQWISHPNLYIAKHRAGS